MKRYLIFLLLFGAGAARADTVINLNNPDQSGNPGDTLVFNGFLANTGVSTIFLNSVDLNLAGSSFTVDFIDLFFNNVPPFLDPSGATLDIELFSILINSPFLDPDGTYMGTYTLLGGLDSSSQDVLASAGFSITVPNAVPEPSSFALVSVAILVLVRMRYRPHGSGSRG